MHENCKRQRKVLNLTSLEFHWPLLQMSDYNTGKPHDIININHQTGNWNENQSASKTQRFYF